jgi:MFS family permease
MSFPTSDTTLPSPDARQPQNELLRRVDEFVAGPPMVEDEADNGAARVGRRFLWLDGLIANASESFVGSFLGPFALAYGANNGQIGLLSAVTNLAAAAGLVPGARWGDKTGRRKLIVLLFNGGLGRVLLLAAAIAPLLLGKPSLVVTAIIALTALRAFVNQVGYPAWSSLSAEIVPQRIRGRYFSSRNIAIAIGALIFAPIAGAMIQAVGTPHGYMLSFALAGLIGFVATYMYWHIPEAPAPATTADATAAVPARGRDIMAALRSRPRFLAFCAVALFWNLTLQVAGPFFSVYMVRNLSATPFMIGFLATMFGIGNILGMRMWGRLNDHKGAAWVMRTSGLLIPLVPCIWAIVPSIGWLIPEEALSGFLWAGYTLASFNLLLSLAPETQRGRFVAIYQLVVSVAAFIGPLLGSYLADSLGIRSVFWISAAGRLIASLLFFFTVHGDVELKR